MSQSSFIRDIFGEVFGDTRQGGRHSSGADLGYEFVLTLEEAVLGSTKSIKVPTQVKCEICIGKGTRKGSDLIQPEQLLKQITILN